MPFYDRLIAVFIPENAIRRVMTELSALATEQWPAEHLIVDAGCGTGSHLLSLAQRLPNARLCGIDIDPRVLRTAKQKLERHNQLSVHLLAGSMTKLPLDGSSAQLVVSTLTFHHLQPNEKQFALSEIFRVLCPGGTFLMTDLAMPSNFYQRLQFTPVRLLDGWSRTACNISGRLPQLISEAGFRSVDEVFKCNSLLGTIRTYRAVR